MAGLKCIEVVDAIVGTTDRAGRITVADSPAEDITSQRAHIALPRHTATDQADIADDGAISGITKQADKIRAWPIDHQVADGVAQTVKAPGKVGAGVAGQIADRGKTGIHRRLCETGVPGRGSGRIHVSAQRVVSRQIGVDGLQASAAARCSTHVVDQHPRRVRASHVTGVGVTRRIGFGQGIRVANRVVVQLGRTPGK